MGAESTGDQLGSRWPDAEAHRVEALRALHDRYAAMLWRYVVSLTHRPADADDVVQETLLRAWRRPSILEEDPEQVHRWPRSRLHRSRPRRRPTCRPASAAPASSSVRSRPPPC